MPAPCAFDYAILRVVPRVDREEFLNAGVILHSFERGFLEASIALDPLRLAAFAPGLDAAFVQEHLDAVARICGGEGPIGALPPKERFRWLVAPRSTIVQASPVQPGLCADPGAALQRLVDTMVRVPASG